jgi:hypothetical protein
MGGTANSNGCDRVMTQITKELAQKIAEKLDAVVIPSGGAHKVMGVYYNDLLIASFGIRHGSNKDAGHDHVQKELKVSTGFAKALARCTKYRDDWLEELRDKNLIPRENQQDQ